MGQVHKTFVSYHHANDEDRRKIFELRFGNKFGVILPGGIRMGDMSGLKTDTIRGKIRDEYLRDTTVTVVLIGTQTWQRKHVDWEIGSSIRETEFSPRSGLLGILLPSYQKENPDGYNPYTLPPRLYDNVKNEYASLYNWSEDPKVIAGWIHKAFLRRKTSTPDNSFPHFVNNRSGERWCR